MTKHLKCFLLVICLGLMACGQPLFADEKGGTSEVKAEAQAESHPETAPGEPSEKASTIEHGKVAQHHEGGHEEHEVASFREVAKPLTFRIVNFLIFVAVLYFGSRKMVKKYLEERRKTIAEIIEQSAERKKWAEQKYQEYNSRLESISGELEELKRSLRREGEKEREEILRNAEKLAQAMKRDAALVAEAELQEVKKELRAEAIETAAMVAKETVMRLKTPEDEKRLAKEFIDEIARESRHE